ETDQTPALGATPTQPAHFRVYPAFVEENQLFQVQARQALLPVLPLLSHVRPALLAGVEGLFLSVSFMSASARWIVLMLTGTDSCAWSSASVASGVFSTSFDNRWRSAPSSLGSGPCFCWMAPRRFRSRKRCLTRRHHERLTLNRSAISAVCSFCSYASSTRSRTFC